MDRTNKHAHCSFLFLKLLGLTLFISVPVVGFFLGRMTARISKPAITIMPSPPTRIGSSVSGLVYTTGITPEEKERLGLRYSAYQLLTDDDRSFFLEYKNESVLANLVGSCVRIEGTISPSGTFAPRDGYGRRLYIPSRMTRLAPKDCGSIPSVALTPAAPEKTMNVSGTILRMTRPAPDIAYDYGMQLDTPYTDNENASGLPQRLLVLVIVPQNEDVRRVLQSKIGSPVTAVGYMAWGYAESRHFIILEVK